MMFTFVGSETQRRVSPPLPGSRAGYVVDGASQLIGQIDSVTEQVSTVQRHLPPGGIQRCHEQV